MKLKVWMGIAALGILVVAGTSSVLVAADDYPLPFTQEKVVAADDYPLPFTLKA